MKKNRGRRSNNGQDICRENRERKRNLEEETMILKAINHWMTNKTIARDFGYELFTREVVTKFVDNYKPWEASDHLLQTFFNEITDPVMKYEMLIKALNSDGVKLYNVVDELKLYQRLDNARNRQLKDFRGNRQRVDNQENAVPQSPLDTEPESSTSDTEDVAPYGDVQPVVQNDQDTDVNGNHQQVDGQTTAASQDSSSLEPETPTSDTDGHLVQNNGLSDVESDSESGVETENSETEAKIQKSGGNRQPADGEVALATQVNRGPEPDNVPSDTQEQVAGSDETETVDNATTTQTCRNADAIENPQATAEPQSSSEQGPPTNGTDVQGEDEETDINENQQPVDCQPTVAPQQSLGPEAGTSAGGRQVQIVYPTLSAQYVEETTSWFFSLRAREQVRFVSNINLGELVADLDELGEYRNGQEDADPIPSSSEQPDDGNNGCDD